MTLATVVRFDPDLAATQALARRFDTALLPLTLASPPAHQHVLALVWIVQKAVRRHYCPEDWHHVADLLHAALRDHFAAAVAERARGG